LRKTDKGDAGRRKEEIERTRGRRLECCLSMVSEVLMRRRSEEEELEGGKVAFACVSLFG
jgi:hypothetical protein